MLITICNTRSKRVNDNIVHMPPIKLCIHAKFGVFFVGVSVIEILEFNWKKMKKNMAKL